MGLCVCVIGIAGAFDGNLILVMASVTLGIIAGELAHIDAACNKFGAFLQKKLAKEENNSAFAEGFVTASLIFCVGAISIVGSIESGMSGDLNTLIIKSILDGVTALILTSRFGIGVLFAAVPVFLYQGAIELTATFLTVSMETAGGLITQIAAVGGVLILAIGLNLSMDAKIKTANLLPALVFAVGFYYLFTWIGLI